MTCPHCRGVFFVGWDGQPELADHTAEPEPEVPIPPAMDGGPSESVHVDFGGVEVPPPSEAPVEPGIWAISSENENPPESEFVASPESFATEDSLAESAFGSPANGGFSDPPAPESSFGVDSGDLSDIAAYANSDPGVGPLNYTVRIRGLELAETFELLREAVTDSRFGWDAEDVMGQVANGELRLTGLTPTKASILVNRIKYLSIEVEWAQEIFGR